MSARCTVKKHLVYIEDVYTHNDCGYSTCVQCKKEILVYDKKEDQAANVEITDTGQPHMPTVWGVKPS